MVEALLEVVVELAFSLLGRLFLGLGLTRLSESFRNPSAWLAACGSLLGGAVCGGLSLLVFPRQFTPPGSLRAVNLVLVPIATGFLVMLAGALRAAPGEPPLRLGRFVQGWLFAVPLTAIRYAWAA